MGSINVTFFPLAGVTIGKVHHCFLQNNVIPRLLSESVADNTIFGSAAC